MKFLVLGVKKYDFVQEGTGEVFQGMNITALDMSQNVKEPDKRGIFPMKIKSPDIQLFNQFDVLPGIYDLDFAMKPNGKGDPVVTLTDAVMLDGVRIEPLAS
jgi:hypothetical protein